jgi:hypothetical protein
MPSNNLLARLAALAALIVAIVPAQAATYALLIGVGDYPDVLDADGKPVYDEEGNRVDNDLAGCVNDVTAMKGELVARFGVPEANIKVVTNADATEKGFVDGVTWLLLNAKPGDQVFFQYSGHGTQLAAVDEPDGKEEAICLYDDVDVPGDFFRTMAEALAKGGVRATFFFDSCFSGGMSRNPAPGKIKAVKSRFISPRPKARALMPSKRSMPAQQAVEGSFAFLFASQEDQPSSDLQFVDATLPAHGAFTLSVLESFKQTILAPARELIRFSTEVVKMFELEQVPSSEFSSEKRANEPMLLKG